MPQSTRLRRAARIAGYAAAGAVVLALLVGLTAPLLLTGPRFGNLVESLLPETRGRIDVGGGRWSWSALLALVRARPASFALHDVRITDPEGTQVLAVRRITAAVELDRRAGRFLVRGLRVEGASWRFARMKQKDRVGFLAAMEPVPTRRPSRPGRAGVSEIAITDAELDGLETVFDFPSWGLKLQGVRARGALALGRDATGRQAFSFEVRDADVPGGGHLRILGQPSSKSPPDASFELPFSKARLERVATTTDAPDAISVRASSVTTGGSTLALSALFSGVYGVTAASRSPGVELTARFGNAADAVREIAAGHGVDRKAIGGANAALDLGLSGPYTAIRLAADAARFDLQVGALRLTDLAFNLDAEPLIGRFKFGPLSLASPAGGRLKASVNIDRTWNPNRVPDLPRRARTGEARPPPRDRLNLSAHLDFERFDPGPLLPPPLRPFAAGKLDGTVQANVDLRAASGSIVAMALSLERPEGERPRVVRLRSGAKTGAKNTGSSAPTLDASGIRFEAGTIHLPRISLALWKGRVSAGGRIAVWDPAERRWSPPSMNLSVRGDRIATESMLGIPFVDGAVSFRSRIEGTVRDLGVDVSIPKGEAVSILGERVALPPRLSARLTDDTLVVEELRLEGPKASTLTASGRLTIAGQGRLQARVDVRDFPLERLPGLSQTALPLAGRLSGELRLSGALQAPDVTGRIRLASLTFDGRSIGDGSGEIGVTSGPRGALRAHASLAGSIAADGVLVPGPRGLSGEATLELRRLRLDPFLSDWPVSGFVSGKITARVAPGQPASADGVLSELTASVTPPRSRRAAGPPPRPIELRAQSPIRLSARTGSSSVSFGPARFASNAGNFELGAVGEGGDARATVKGRLDLGALAPFAGTWVERLAGAVDVDFAARANTGGGFVLSGSASVATPIALRPVGFPLDLSVPSGRFRIANQALETSGLPFSVRADSLAASPVRRAAVTGRLTGRIGGTPERPQIGARVDVDRLELSVPLLGPTAIRGGKGFVEIQTRNNAPEIARIDLPFSGEASGVQAPDAFIDRSRFDLRLRGSPHTKLSLSGVVDIAAARVRPKAAKAASAAPGSAGPLPKTGFFGRPEIETMQLDLRLRSRDGAIVVEVPNLPDLRVDADYAVTGTIKHPTLAGKIKGANVYSAIALTLRRLFDD